MSSANAHLPARSAHRAQSSPKRVSAGAQSAPAPIASADPSNRCRGPRSHKQTDVRGGPSRGSSGVEYLITNQKGVEEE